MSNNDTNRSRQLNPCDHLFWKSRGYPERPYNWRQILEDTGYYDDDDSQEDEYSSESYYDEEEDSEESYDEEEEDSEESYDSDYEEHCSKSNQNNPNNDEYWQLRGWTCRPDDWKDRINGTLPQVKSPAQPQNKNEWWKHGPNRIR